MGKKQILITGAYGKVGTGILENLAGVKNYNFTCFDRADHPSHLDTKKVKTIFEDVTDSEKVRSSVEGKDAVIHLAAHPRVDTPWKEVLNNKIIATYTTLHAAAEESVSE